MKKTEFQTLLKNGFPSVPESFHLRVEETLKMIEHSKEDTMMKGTFKKTWVFILAAMLIIGTAFAAGTHFGLMDFLTDVKPAQNAQEHIQKNLGSTQIGQALYTLHEAVYDGECVRALLEISPVSPATHAICPDFEPDFVSDALSKLPPDKIAVPIPYPAMETSTDSVPMDFLYTEVSAMREGENGSILMYLSSPVAIREYTTGKNIRVREAEKPAQTLPVRFLTNPNAYGNGEACGIIPFTLEMCASDTAQYASESMQIGNVSLSSVRITRTPFASYLEIQYAYADNSAKVMLAPDTLCYAAQMGAFFHTSPDCSGMQNAKPITCGEALSMGKTLCPTCASCISQTYYATEMGMFLHTSPDCSGMQNALSLTYAEAVAMRKSFLCPVCAGGSEEAVMTALTGGQIDFSLNTENTLFFEGRQAAADKDFMKTYIFDAGSDFPEEITLTLHVKGEKTNDTLLLKRK